MNTFYCETIQQPISFLNEEESHHCVRVMRTNAGDAVSLIDGKGGIAIGTVAEANKKKTSIQIEEVKTASPPKKQLTICFAPTKSNDRTEWFLEKATEFGVTKICFMQSQNSERTKINIDRFRRVVLSATKQSLTPYLPELVEMQNFSTILKQKPENTNCFIATLRENEDAFEDFLQSTHHTQVLIGPEGGFTEQEVEQAIDANYKAIRLGNHRLRAETAGLYVAMLNYEHQ